MFSLRKTESLNVWIVKIIIFVIPFLPLYISLSMPFPFITGKNFAFRIAVELAAALWVGIIIAKKEYRIHNSPILLSILIFTFFVGMADLFGINPYNSFWSNFERMEGYVTILHLVLYFMILKSIFKTRNQWKIFFALIMLVSVCVSLFPLFFTFNRDILSFRRLAMEYGTREFSLIGNPPFLAAYLLMASFIGLILIFHVQKAYVRFGCLMAVVLHYVVIYLTATRGVILSAVAGVIIFISAYIFRRSDQSGTGTLKRTVLMLCIMSVIISGVLFIFSDAELVRQDQTLSRFSSMLSSESVKSRIDVWGKAWNAIKERPFLGWGQENFIAIYTVSPIILVESQIWMDRAHNIVIEWLINAGILGLFSYLAIFGSAFYTLREARRREVLSKNETVMIFTVLVVYFLQNLFTFDTINTYIIFFALLAYIDNLASNVKQEDSGPEGNTSIKNINIIFITTALAALICFSFIFYYINYKPIKQARQYMRIGFSSVEDSLYSEILKEFNNALSLNAFGDSEVRTSMRVLSHHIIRKQDFKKKGALKFIQSTVNELKKEIAVKNYDLEFMTDVIIFYNQIALYENSFIDLSEALIENSMKVNPGYQWLQMVMADINIMKKDYENAYRYIKSIADPDPDNEKKQFKLALTALYSSKEEAAEKALENLKKIRISKDEKIFSKRKSFLSLVELYQLAQVYRETARYHIAIQYLEEMIRTVSMEKMYFEQDFRYYRPKMKARETAQIYIEIADVYLKLNDKANALKMIKKAAEIDTGIAEDLQVIIDSINNKI